MVKEVLAYKPVTNYYGELKKSFPNLGKNCSLCSIPYKDSDAVTAPSNFSHVWCQLKGPVLTATRAFEQYVYRRYDSNYKPPTDRETIKYSEQTKYVDEISLVQTPQCSNCENPFKVGEAITNDSHVWCRLNSPFFKKNFEQFVERQDPSLPKSRSAPSLISSGSSEQQVAITSQQPPDLIILFYALGLIVGLGTIYWQVRS